MATATPGIGPYYNFTLRKQATIAKPQRGGYKVNGETYDRVTSVVGVYPKHLDNWLLMLARESIGEVLDDPEQRENIGLASEEAWPTLREFLLSDVKARTDHRRTASADFGTSVHAAIEAYLDTGKMPDESDPTTPYVVQATEFLVQRKIGIVDTEVVVWDDDRRIAGTIDAVGRSGDRLIIWDWKTSKDIYPEYAYQLAAYAECLGNLCGEWVSEALVVRLTDHSYEVRSVDLAPLGWSKPVHQGFEMALTLYRQSKLVADDLYMPEV